MNNLVFFDINGTIIERDERTDLPYKIAIDKALKLKNGMEGVDNAARSDRDVFMEILDNNNLNYSDKMWNKFLEEYEKQLIKYSKTDVWRANVDAVDFIKKLSDTDCEMMLITGELKIGSKYKLEKIGVWNYFPDGGFGEDSPERFKIAEAALKKANKLFGKEFDKIYVIGDTILDIQTARHINAISISITTGANTKDELAEENPDYIIDNFEEVNNIFFKKE